MNKEQKDFFSEILANPGQVNATHIQQLKKLVNLFPHSGILRAMLARAHHDYEGFQQKLHAASVYAPDRTVLYNLINYPEKLKPAEKLQVAKYKATEFYQDYQVDEVPAYDYSQLEAENIAAASFNEPADSIGTNAVAPAPFETYTPPAEDTIAVASTIPFEEDATDSDYAGYNYPVNTDAPYQPEIKEEAPVPQYSYTPPSPASTGSEIDDEVYEEITSIDDIDFDRMYNSPAIIETPRPKAEPVVPAPEEPQVTPEYENTEALESVIMAQYGWAANLNEQAETPVEKENVYHEEPVNENYAPEINTPEQNVTADYTAPANYAATEELEYEVYEDDEPAPQAQTTKVFSSFEPIIDPKPEDDDLRVSKYDDDTLPYTFMWWLDKTRKEHASTHQPYTSFKPITREVTRDEAAAPNELQQQYFENIFHISSVDDLEKSTADKTEAETKKKEDEIIERFIQEDPQIKPPTTDKIDNENKAKKSAEDQAELVSETLAKIYTDQMLYPKAILTYQKLILKFPEKSSYFVAQIKLLEKKIN